MPTYEHHCRECNLYWEEEYSTKDLPPDTCPQCEGLDVYRCVSDAGAIHFKGAGWSPDGYYKNKSYDIHKAQGKDIKLYDRKEDIDRDMRGEAMVREKKRLLKQNEAAKRHLGPDAAVTASEAETKIKAAGEKAVK